MTYTVKECDLSTTCPDISMDGFW